MAAPSSPPSTPTFALAQFALTMEPIEGVRRSRRRRQTRWGREAAASYSLGRQLEDRQLLALGGRCGYFPAEIVRRWLAEDTPLSQTTWKVCLATCERSCRRFRGSNSCSPRTTSAMIRKVSALHSCRVASA